MATSGDRERFLAHSTAKSGHEDSVPRHLAEVAELAAGFAGPLGLPNLARAAGLLHDLGKYGDKFQLRLQGAARNIDHWSAGAWVLLAMYAQPDAQPAARLAALAAMGHHLGLPWADDLRPGQPLKPHPPEKRLSESDPHQLLARFKVDGLRPPNPTTLRPEAATLEAEAAPAMLDARLLFSCLVDADYLATEAHFRALSRTEPYRRPTGPDLQSGPWLELVLAHLRQVAAAAPASSTVKALRADMLQACLEAAALPPGLFTLTAPTGSGKTLAMLAFALAHAQAHAQAHGLRRVVTVIPYLTIIEQTVKVYRQALAGLGEASLDQVVLEDHSLAGDASGEDDDRDHRRLLAENWDAPLVVTTSVRFLESLFANRPGACRKLHRLSGSVILLDEVQTLPVGLAAPTLATLDRLAQRYGATLVMATATQPAFEHLADQVRELGGAGWAPREIVPTGLNLFGRVRRVRACWPGRDETMTWPEVARGMLAAPGRQALGVVNLKRHAIALHQELKALDAPGLLHLSTNLCPAHRQAVLEEVQRRLKANEPCLLVSTQCVEAGVDLDLPTVWRAWGPLEALAQAAGRCNRGGRWDKGELVVFRPQPEPGHRRLYPDDGYAQAASATENLWREMKGALDLDDPELFRRYYHLRYLLRGERLTPRELHLAIGREDHPTVARLYRIIDQPAVNVLTPYRPPDQPGLSDELVDEARDRDFVLHRTWLRRARRLAVSLFPPRTDDPLTSWLEPLPAGYGRMAEGWCILRQDSAVSAYDDDLGLRPPGGWPVLEV